MPKIKEIELIYKKAGDEQDALNQRGTICVKIRTTKGIAGDYVELPQEATIEDAITAANLLLAGCKDMTM